MKNYYFVNFILFVLCLACGVYSGFMYMYDTPKYAWIHTLNGIGIFTNAAVCVFIAALVLKTWRQEQRVKREQEKMREQQIRFERKINNYIKNGRR